MVETTYTRPDIVVRLRQNATHSGDSRMIAAEEIEHLRARVAELEGAGIAGLLDERFGEACTMKQDVGYENRMAEYAIDGRIGAARMAAGLSSIPNPVYGDLMEVLKLHAQIDDMRGDILVMSATLAAEEE